MHLRTKLTLLAVMVIALLPTAANAYACDGNHHSGVAAAAYTQHKGYGVLHASATYLGVTADQLKAKLKAGQSLGQVANATPGKSSAGLVDYLTGLVKAKLDPFVANHKLTPAQEATILARVQTKATTLVNATWTGRMDLHH
jgi:hypothetical protein